MIVLNLMDVLGSRAKVEEQAEGMEEHHHHHDHGDAHEEEEHHHDHDAVSEDKDHDDDHDEDHEEHHHDHDALHADHDHEGHEEGEHHHEPEYDEHIWLSLKNAEVLTDAIAEALSKADAAHADAYRKNAAVYREKLAALDKEYQETIAGAPNKTLLFCDRFPFRYLVDDYGLKYYAAFSGCSAETEALRPSPFWRISWRS